MKKKLNPALIGAFVLAAIGLVIAAGLYLGADRFSGKTSEFVAYFRSQTFGLEVGAPVVLQGVKIGQVTAINVIYEKAQFNVHVTFQTDQDAVVWPREFLEHAERDPEGLLDNLIAKGLRAKLAKQSIVTGKLMVELGFFPDTKVVLHGDREEIPTIPSSLEQFFKKLEKIDIEKIATNLERISVGVAEIVEANRVGEIEERALTTLETINDAFADLQVLVRHIDTKVDGVAGSIEAAGTGIGTLTNKVEARVDPLVTDLRRAVNSADKAFKAAARVLDEADAMIDENSPLRAELSNTLRNLSEASRSLKDFADYLQRHPEALLKGKR